MESIHGRDVSRQRGHIHEGMVHIKGGIYTRKGHNTRAAKTRPGEKDTSYKWGLFKCEGIKCTTLIHITRLEVQQPFLALA